MIPAGARPARAAADSILLWTAWSLSPNVCAGTDDYHHKGSVQSNVRSGRRGGPVEIRLAIDRFLQAAKQPALLEAGEESIALSGNNLVLEDRGAALLLQAWDERRNLVRRLSEIESEGRGRLELRAERFGKKFATLTLLDLDRSSRERLELRGARLEFREQMRRFLRRQFSGYKVAELSTEANLEDSLSPAYARALLRDGASAWAAIGAGPDCLNLDGVLSFGLIWLDYLRRRERGLTVRGLILLLPAAREKTTCLRLRHLNAAIADFHVFAYSPDGVEYALDLRDYGNVDTRLEPVCRRRPGAADEIVTALLEKPYVEAVNRPAGEIGLRVNGLEFARTAGETIVYGIETYRVAKTSNLTNSGAEIERLAEGLARFRSADARDKLNPLYLKGRELWLESRVRNSLEQIDATLLPSPVYGQTPTLAAGDRGLVDLLAAGRDGRLSIIELKASEDIHLPLQALDYWIRVKWHLDRGEFEPAGYFPDLRLRREPPKMMLLAPALEFHPSNETVLRYFSPGIEVERVGVGADWQREMKIMFRM